MVNPWFKFYGGEYLSDPKMDALDGNERSCWITILSLANQSENGVIKYVSEKKILEKSNIKEDQRELYTGLLSKLQDLGMIRLCNGNVTEDIEIINWEKRQYSESYLRVKKHREKESNEIVTPKITTEEKREEEKRKEKKRKEKITDKAVLEKTFFENPLMQEVQKQFPDRNYKFQFDLMCDWWKTNKNQLPQNISAFTNWLKNTKPDELLQVERRKQIDRETQEKRIKEMIEIPKASEEKLTAMRKKMELIGRKI